MIGPKAAAIATGFAYVDALDRPTQVIRGSDTAQTTSTYVDTPNAASETTTSGQATWDDSQPFERGIIEDDAPF
jgi:hypothetical protein